MLGSIRKGRHGSLQLHKRGSLGRQGLGLGCMMLGISHLPRWCSILVVRLFIWHRLQLLVPVGVVLLACYICTGLGFLRIGLQIVPGFLILLSVVVGFLFLVRKSLCLFFRRMLGCLRRGLLLKLNRLRPWSPRPPRAVCNQRSGGERQAEDADQGNRRSTSRVPDQLCFSCRSSVSGAASSAGSITL